jgi:uncharacterized damage-inducible protein DinB
MDDIWRDALHYNRWANLTLLESCSGLTEAQLGLTAPGTYGTIAATWLHLLGAEQRYLRRLTGAEPTISEKHDYPGIAGLKEHARRSGDALVEAAARLESDDTTQVDFDGQMVGMRKSLIVVQAIHHGNDHRTHICTILGSHAIPYADMDVWTYALALHRGVAV